MFLRRVGIGGDYGSHFYIAIWAKNRARFSEIFSSGKCSFFWFDLCCRWVGAAVWAKSPARILEIFEGKTGQAKNS
jgi:hypothetical protein